MHVYHAFLHLFSKTPHLHTCTCHTHIHWFSWSSIRNPAGGKNNFNNFNILSNLCFLLQVFPFHPGVFLPFYLDYEEYISLCGVGGGGVSYPSKVDDRYLTLPKEDSSMSWRKALPEGHRQFIGRGSAAKGNDGLGRWTQRERSRIQTSLKRGAESEWTTPSPPISLHCAPHRPGRSLGFRPVQSCTTLCWERACLHLAFNALLLLS